ncbi:hypothetical protein CDAR_272811 [Caerostris darwini]|uniref:Uncharacterized protein n=1 Tax=Caerostris darwini TaxID=1538125 RepID=A0AAV4V025_9ARAC|nr:hypothetical protein CDAR_272811 [Caerostris darwini]
MPLIPCSAAPFQVGRRKCGQGAHVEGVDNGLSAVANKQNRQIDISDIQHSLSAFLFSFPNPFEFGKKVPFEARFVSHFVHRNMPRIYYCHHPHLAFIVLPIYGTCAPWNSIHPLENNECLRDEGMPRVPCSAAPFQVGRRKCGQGAHGEGVDNGLSAAANKEWYAELLGYLL